MPAAAPRNPTPHTPVPQTIDEYIAVQAPPAQAALILVRDTLRKALPRAQEVISYKMPGYLIAEDAVLSFAAWKNHYSLYGATEGILAAFTQELGPYKIQKGTISFPYSVPVPVKLIDRIARFRAKEIVVRRAKKS
jgi:uncharacterized protein YdhG (YjbR/CyaY superfamily)